MGAAVMLLAAREAGRIYYFWQNVTPEIAPPRFTRLDPDGLSTILDELRASLPGTFRGESPGDEPWLGRVLRDGVLADRERERAFSARLADQILDPRFVSDLVEAARGGRVTLQVAPSPSLILVPWELLLPQVDGRRVRLSELADVVLLPGEYADGRAAEPEPWQREDGDAPVVYVVDPVNRAEASLLDLDQRDEFASRCARPVSLAGDMQPGGTVDRVALGGLLRASPRPARMFYLGHVANSSDEPAASSLLLSDRSETYGYAQPVRRMRPFSAQDWLMGTLEAPVLAEAAAESAACAVDALIWPVDGPPADGADIWPAPKRVALIACNSGSDLSHEEPFGLVAACVKAGAEHVTATRWTLLADAAFRPPGMFRRPGDPQPLLEMAIAIDACHDASDPVAAIADWIRQRTRAWDDSGALEDSPIMWAALVTYWAPPKPVRPLSDDERAVIAARPGPSAPG